MTTVSGTASTMPPAITALPDLILVSDPIGTEDHRTLIDELLDRGLAPGTPLTSLAEAIRWLYSQLQVAAGDRPLAARELWEFTAFGLTEIDFVAAWKIIHKQQEHIKLIKSYVIDLAAIPATDLEAFLAELDAPPQGIDPVLCQADQTLARVIRSQVSGMLAETTARRQVLLLLGFASPLAVDRRSLERAVTVTGRLTRHFSTLVRCWPEAVQMS